PPRDPAAPFLSRPEVLRSALSGLLLTLATLAFFARRLPAGEAYARGAGLTVLVLGILLLTWAERAGVRPWWKVPWPRTAVFWVVLPLVAASLVLILEVPALAGVFRVAPLSPKDGAIACGLAWAAVGWRAWGRPIVPFRKTGARI
ncbi:MAG TPA: cation transporting ATPase C-terminal domain-containing protein, partial [bacterium]|nr:cation transporting ATPase C-terminal domain-containing protein [bacterium]